MRRSVTMGASSLSPAPKPPRNSNDSTTWLSKHGWWLRVDQGSRSGGTPVTVRFFSGFPMCHIAAYSRCHFSTMTKMRVKIGHIAAYRWSGFSAMTRIRVKIGHIAAMGWWDFSETTQTDQQANRQAHRRSSAQANRRTGGQVHRRASGQAGKRTSGQTRRKHRLDVNCPVRADS